MKYIYLISIALMLFTGINLEWEFFSNRLLRVFTSWALLLFSAVLILKKTAAPTPFIALLLLAICDISLLNWEHEFSKPIYYTLHSLTSITFLFIIKWQTQKPSLSKFDWLYILVITGILSWVMITLGTFFSEEINDPILQVLFYINGFLSVILSISAFIFSASSTDNYSSYFLLAIVGLAISDLFLFMIYIMDFLDLRYIDNFLNILGFAFMISYMIRIQLLKKTEENLLSDKNRAENENLVMTLEEANMYS